MDKRVSLFLLRMALGWLFFYAGITKVLDPNWTSLGYLKGANTFSSFYGWLASPDILPIVDLLNEWGLTLIGLTLILGIWVRFSAVLGILMMVLYYFPTLDFPYPNSHSFIVDDHLIYVAGLLVLVYFRAGDFWGVSGLLRKCKK